jgi:predicted DnaQ family exonuclease/DinG family helicase
MECIILDIETTGLDPDYSSIIEVAVLRVKDGEVQEEFSSFVSYDYALPDTTKHLTGITDEMLKGSPAISDVVLKLKDFIGKLPVIAHNGFSFDFRMLEREGLKIEEKYDSLEFAFFVLPTNLEGHNMDALAGRFNLGKTPHRALPDCRLELEVIKQLQAAWKKKPEMNRGALKSLAERTGWWWAPFLSGESLQIDDLSKLVPVHEAYRKENPDQDPLALTQEIEPATVDTFFEPGTGGPQYAEKRPEQVEVARFIVESFNKKTHAVIEAGTGVGKSKAYLTPSVLFALKNQIPVAISTYTKALQDQLAVKEIPHIKEIVNPNLRVAVVKGKQNYVCLKKFKDFTDEMITELSQRSLYEHGTRETNYTTRLSFLLLSSWILETERGDWEELPFWLTASIPKRVEYDICNKDELCAADVCDLYDEKKCFLAKTRLRARDADLVIMNHAVLLSGIQPTRETEEKIVSEEGEENILYTHTVLPSESRFVVIDEAHHLEDAATSAWTCELSRIQLDRLMGYLFDERRGARHTMDAVINNSTLDRLVHLGDTYDGIEQNLKLEIESLFGTKGILDTLLPDNPETQWSQHLTFSDLSKTPDNMKSLIDVLKSAVERLTHAKEILQDFAAHADDERNKKTLTIRANMAGRYANALKTLADKDEYFVRFIERQKSSILLKAAPLSIAEDMNEKVFKTFHSVVLTSATITVGESFNFFAHRCGTELIEDGKVRYKQVPSSFDYEKQVQFFVPKGITYGSGRDAKAEHLKLSIAFLKDAIVASHGGALILCSSHEQVDLLYAGLKDHLSQNNIWLLRQNRNYSIASVVRDFSNDLNSVLIGTSSLWQGVDVPGPALRSLFIYKIPYRNPSDPLISARREEIENARKDSFGTYYEPLAALDLKQGFGRLIRKKTDVGVVVLLDERLARKPLLVKSFPPGVHVVTKDPTEIIAALMDLVSDKKM